MDDFNNEYIFNENELNLDDDNMYELVYEREKMNNFRNTPPKSITNFSGIGTEHFSNTKKTKNLNKILIIVLLLLIVYFGYNYMCENTQNNIPDGVYLAHFNTY